MTKEEEGCFLCPAGFTSHRTGLSECPDLEKNPFTEFIVLGCLLFAMAIIAVYFCYYCKKKNNEKKRNDKSNVELQIQLEEQDNYVKRVMNPLEQDKFIIDSANLELGKRIGQGACGWVFKAKLGASTIVAAKEVMSSMWDEKNEEFEHEANILTQLNHPHVLRVFGFCTKNAKDSKDHATHQYIVTELARNGSLETAIAKIILSLKKWNNSKEHLIKKQQALEQYRLQALNWAVEIASGMSYLHSRGLIHRDIKPGKQNMLVVGCWLLVVGCWLLLDTVTRIVVVAHTLLFLLSVLQQATFY